MGQQHEHTTCDRKNTAVLRMTTGSLHTAVNHSSMLFVIVVYTAVESLRPREWEWSVTSSTAETGYTRGSGTVSFVLICCE